MTYEIEYFSVPGGVGFRLVSGGATTHLQSSHPDQPGCVPMTAAEAQEIAAAIVERLTAPQMIPID